MVLSKFTLKQFLNVPGLKAIGLIFTSPQTILPHQRVKHVSHINYEQLADRGIKCLVFDKDNTLSYCYNDTLHPSVIQSIAKANRLFPNGVAILSNSAGSSDDEDYKMAAKTETATGIPVIRHEVKKPGCLVEVLDHFERVQRRKIQPNEICVIGDRLMTDVVFANQNQMVSVLVDPLSNLRDHPVAIIFRLLELQVVLPFVYFLLWVKRLFRGTSSKGDSHSPRSDGSSSSSHSGGISAKTEEEDSSQDSNKKFK